jgi:RNA-directed DNA polymerase
METILGINYHKNGTINPSSECQLVKYADDFIIFARCKEDCLKAKAKLTPWLAERGLKLSEAKTHIHHMDDGFDFLGFNIKHYKDKRKKTGKTCHTKPSKESIKAFKQQMVIEWKKMLGVPTKRLIENINPKIKGWSNYFRIGVSSSIFSKLDHWMWQRQAIYAGRRHPHKSWRWKKEKYWGRIKGRNDNWIFMDKDHKHTYLWKMSWTPIKRHIMVKGSSSPDDPALKEYWRARQAKNCKYIVKLRSILWRKQKGICPVCKDNIDNGESIDIHHITPRKLGGGDQLENLVMLHTNCHRQTHSKAGQQIQDVSKLLEPYAG